MSDTVPKTFGALLVGGIIATLFCGVTQAQTFVYLRLYNSDPILVKLLVLGVWLLDTLHTIFISQSLWGYLIGGFGNPSGIDHVSTSLALTIAVTAILTFLVHWFFIYRVFVLAQKSYFIAAPLGAIACARLGFACVTTAKLIQLRSLNRFVELFSWSFTTGLTLSAILDVVITGLLCWLLKTRQREYSNLNEVLDSLILYAFENGVLTTVAALLSLITWLSMPDNLIFMATHFIIIKFYANSLLATLNVRRNLKSNSLPHSQHGFSGLSASTSNNAQVSIHLAASRSRHGHRPSTRPIVFSSDYRMGPPSLNSAKGRLYDGSDGEEHSPSSEEAKPSQLRINVNTTTVRITEQSEGGSRILGS